MKDVAGIPQLGLGTYGRRGEEGTAAILAAIEIGYRHIDTAQDYFNEAEVGDAIRKSGLPREDFFVTTKIATYNLGPGALIPSLEKSREQSGLDRFDLTLIHWPTTPEGPADPAVYLPQLADAQANGMTGLIGVSNFTIPILEKSIEILGPGAIATNQVELHPYLQNRKLAAFCKAHGIVVTCYQPIAKGRLKGDPVLEAIAESHGASVEQMALAFEFAKGYVAIPASSRVEHLQSNFAATDLVLSPDEIARIETIDRGERFIDPAWSPEWD